MIINKLKAIILSPIFWVCSFSLFFCLIIGVFEELQVAQENNISILYCFKLTTSIGIGHVVIPVLASTPFVYHYVEELNKKVIYYRIIRSRINVYYLSNIIVAVISTILLVLISVITFTIICFISGCTFYSGSIEEQIFANTWFYEWIVNNELFCVFLLYIIAFVLFSLPWTIISLVTSLIVKNRYIILASPFIINIALSFSMQWLHLDYLDPGITLLKGILLRLPYGGIFHSLAYNGVFTIALALVYYSISRRRFKHDGI